MAIAKVSSVAYSNGANGGTTGSIDTTGASLLVMCLYEFSGTGPGTPTDSKSNTWTGLTATSANGVRTTIWYSVNPTVGTGHTFTYNISATYPAIHALSFSGVSTTSPFDVQNGGSATSTTSAQPGSVTPTADGELLISALGTAGVITSPSINSSFTADLSTTYSGAVNFGGNTAYYVQPTAAAINPTWSWTSAQSSCSRIASFKAAASASIIPQVMHQFRQRTA